MCKIMVGVIIAIALFGSPIRSSAQKEDSRWFCSNYSIDFTSGHLVLRDDTIPLYDIASSYSDRKTGDFLFVTDGKKAFNRNQQPMPHGGNLIGDLNTMWNSSVVSFPVPGSTRKYYAFRALGSRQPPIWDDLVYTVIDLAEDSGRGDVVLNNIVVENGVSNSIAVTPASNGCDAWVLCHSAYDSEYYAFLVTPSGVSKSPVVSRIGSIGSDNSRMKFSVQGDWLAYTGAIINNVAIVAELLHFDRSTGRLSACIRLNRIPGGDKGPYATSFSPSGSRMYLGYVDIDARTTQKLVQYDLTSDNDSTIVASKIIIRSPADQLANYASMWLAVDGKIYVSMEGARISIINKPESLGLLCDFQDTVYPWAQLGFQSIIQSPPNSPYHTGKCDTALMADFVDHPAPSCSYLCVELADKSTLSASSWRWLAPGGHPASSTSAKPTICYDSAGIYPVTLIASAATGTDTITKLVRAANASGSLHLIRETDTTLRSGSAVTIPVSYLLPKEFDHSAEFVRLSFGLSYDSRFLNLPISEIASRVRPDTGWILLTVDSDAGLLRFVYADTGYYPPSLALSHNLKDSLLHLGTFIFDCYSSKLDTAIVKLSYCHLETNQETFGFCDNLENGRVAQIVIQGKNGVAPNPFASAWRIHPNPAGGKSIRVEVPSALRGRQVSLVLYDVLGRERLRKVANGTSKPIELSIAGIEEGTYNLRIETEREVHSEKLEIRR